MVTESTDLDVKDSLVSWTYSQYIDALEKEEALNKVEDETFITSKTSKLTIKKGAPVVEM